jgi:hypothetical protein
MSNACWGIEEPHRRGKKLGLLLFSTQSHWILSSRCIVKYNVLSVCYISSHSLGPVFVCIYAYLLYVYACESIHILWKVEVKKVSVLSNLSISSLFCTYLFIGIFFLGFLFLEWELCPLLLLSTICDCWTYFCLRTFHAYTIPTEPCNINL